MEVGECEEQVVGVWGAVIGQKSILILKKLNYRYFEKQHDRDAIALFIL